MSVVGQICSRFGRSLALGSVRRPAAVGASQRGSSGFDLGVVAATLGCHGHPSLSQIVLQQLPFAVRCMSSASIQPHETPSRTPALNDFVNADVSKMTNEELEDTSTIPGWELIHSPPGKLPRGALVGTVVSTKMQKTVNVAVDRYKIVPKIRKRIRYTRKFMAHDENEVANLGDLVMITPCHRISKMKHFMLRKIIRPKGQL